MSALIFAIAAGLLVYSQTDAFAWDEGFHLLAAQLIFRGKRPYLDFFFPQAALNAYWNAFWMRIFGDTWRVAHAVAALSTVAAIGLAADYVRRRFPAPRSSVAAASATALGIALNIQVVEFGAIGQAYGLALLLTVAAFRASVASVARRGPWMSAAAGFLAAAAAGSTLLTAPVAPVLWLWTLVRNREGNRWTKAAAMVAGGAAAAAPLAVLLAKSPQKVLFDMVKFHLLYRQVAWPDALPHDAGVLFAWLDSSQALILGGLALLGLLVARRQEHRSELYLCGWLSLAISVHLATAHPTFERYFVFIVPFLCILATFGACFWPQKGAVLLIFVLLTGGNLAKRLIEDHDGWRWSTMERMAAEVDRVTPKGAPLYAEEHVYFITRRPPPAGMESGDSHKLEFPAPEAAALGILPKQVIEARIKAREFTTVQMCSDKQIERLGLATLYKDSVEVEDCRIFFGR